MEKFGSHICAYYSKVPISKKNFYEEFGNLLHEINFLTVQFHIYSDNVIHQIESLNIMKDGTQQTSKEKLSRIYDKTDMQYLQTFTIEQKKLMFFT